MNSALNENKAELGVNVLLVSLEVLTDRYGLLNQMVKIFRDGRGETLKTGVR